MSEVLIPVYTSWNTHTQSGNIPIQFKTGDDSNFSNGYADLGIWSSGTNKANSIFSIESTLSYSTTKNVVPINFYVDLTHKTIDVAIKY